MVRRRGVSGFVTAVAVAALIASCGGDGESGDTDDSGGTDGDGATQQDGTTEPTHGGSDATEAPTSTEGDAADAADGGAAVRCDDIFSTAEVEEFFDEPVELTEEANDDVGQLVCTWASVEENDVEDLGIQSLLVQFYSGSPVDGSAFFDPDLYENPTPIDGIGDAAYATGTEGTDYFFIESPVSGALNYLTFDMSAEGGLPMHTPADVEELFRLFHERVT